MVIYYNGLTYIIMFYLSKKMRSIKNILLINNDEIFKNSPKIKEVFNFCEEKFTSYYEEI